MPHRATRLTPRLARVLAVLRDGLWYSSWEIAAKAHADARDCVYELRELGYEIESQENSIDPHGRWRIYRMNLAETKRRGLPLSLAKP